MLQHNLKPYEQPGLFNGQQVTQSLDPCGSPLYHGWQFGDRGLASAFSAKLPLPVVGFGDTVRVGSKVFTARATPTLADEFSVSEPGATLANAINQSLTLAPDYVAYAGVSAAPDAPNILANGTFEANDTGWTGGTRTNAQAYQGVWAYQLGADTLAPVNTFATVALEAGRTYQCKMWCRYDDRTPYITPGFVTFNTQNGTVFGSNDITGKVPSNDTWTEVQFEFTQVAAGGFIQITVAPTASTPPAIWIDSVEIREAVDAAGDNNVFIMARRAGSALNLSVGSTLSGSFFAAPGWNSSIVMTLGTDADNASQQIDWKAYVELWRADVPWGQPDTGTHDKLLGVFELPYVVGDEGYRVDVARYLLNEVSVSLPPRAYSTALEYVGGFVGYRLKAAEQYLNGPQAIVPQIRNLADYGVRWAAPHAVPLAIDPPNNVAVWADSGRGWHEWPEYRLTRQVEAALPVYVWLSLSGSAPASVSLNFTFTLVNGTTSSTSRSLGTVNRSGLYRIDLNPSQPPFNTSIPWMLCSASVSVNSVAQRTVTLRNDLSRDGRRWTTLLWKNRFGAYDSFTFDASSERGLSADRVQYKRDRLPSVIDGYYSEADPIDRVSQVAQNQLIAEARTVLQLNSGLLDVTHYDWLQSLVVAPEVWLADDVSNVSGDVPSWRAVNIADAEWVRGTESNLFNLELEVNYSHPEHVLA